MITVILYRPQTSGNIGATARVMKNFGFKRLGVITPNCDIVDEVAIKRARHAKNILGSATCMHINDLAKFDVVVATTAKIGTDYNVARSPLSPRQLAEDLAVIRGNIALLFGTEHKGLPTALVRSADYTVHIPTSKLYSSMNLSHAVSIVLYELAQEKLTGERLAKFKVVPAKDKQLLLGLIAKSVKKLELPKRQEESQLAIWPKALGKARMTRREAFGLMGFFRKVEKAIKK